jgi:hypothetical protein
VAELPRLSYSMHSECWALYLRALERLAWQLGCRLAASATLFIELLSTEFSEVTSHYPGPTPMSVRDSDWPPSAWSGRDARFRAGCGYHAPPPSPPPPPPPLNPPPLPEPAKARDPLVVRTPAVDKMSLMEMGTP